MIVLILDLDWMFDKSEVPNVNCTKLSSFHKQRKDTVYFVKDMSELTMKYDKIYICGDSDSTPTVNHTILNDKRTTLIGKKFELCGSKKLGSIIMGCRPDYLLYDVQDKDDSYKKANFITFFSDNGEKIVNRQNWKNTKKGIKRTIVTDTVLWKQNLRDIEECLELLKNEKNIVFLAPISINFLINNPSAKEKFFNLHFSKGTQFKWKNDVGSNEESAIKITSFINELRNYTKSQIGAIPLNAFESIDNGWQYDFERLIRAIAIFKKNKIKCFLPPCGVVNHRLISWLIKWCDKGIENSFIEEMVFFNAARNGKRWFHIINDPHSWNDLRTREIIKLLSTEMGQKLLPQLSIQLGNNNIDYTCIDFTIIKNNAYLII